MTGAAVQVTLEMRTGRRHSRAVTSDLSLSRLELLECLWEDGKPQYSEVGNLCDVCGFIYSLRIKTGLALYFSVLFSSLIFVWAL